MACATRRSVATKRLVTFQRLAPNQKQCSKCGHHSHAKPVSGKVFRPNPAQQLCEPGSDHSQRSHHQGQRCHGPAIKARLLHRGTDRLEIFFSPIRVHGVTLYHKVKSCKPFCYFVITSELCLAKRLAAKLNLLEKNG